MKGKGEQRTYWLVGEDLGARERRTIERKARRGSKAQNKVLPQQLGVLKHKNRSLLVPRTSLPRSSSLESPKRLRFATGTMLEHHRYHR